jgi:phenylalanyl-tRNA synthetase beta chain
VYTATLLERPDANDDELSADALAPLEASGMQSVSAPVDATNLSNLELGQPTHAFDADAIRGRIAVRRSRPGEQAWLLFTPGPREIPAGTLVIADDEKILAIAGVIGCEESKSTETTRRILLESATFDPVSVRKAARALGVHTDSSARFERGADPSYPLVGAGRVVALLEEAGWRRRGPTGVESSWADPNRLIPLDIAATAAFLEHPLTDDEVRDRLGRYGFAVSPPYPRWSASEGWPDPPGLEELSRERLRTTVLVRVPPHRLWDVELAADLQEELARSIGYNHSPSRLPPVDLGALPTRVERARALASEVLVAAGFYEVVTDGFYGRDLPERAGIGAGHPLARHVETQNALDRGYSLLKNNALLQAVDAVATNLNMRNPEVKAFEWTRTFHADPDSPNEVCRERNLLWAIACGGERPRSWSGGARPADVFFGKGLVAALASALRLPLEVGPADPRLPVASLLHPRRQLAIRLGAQVVGALGEVHPGALRGWKIRRERPLYLEIDEAALAGEPAAFAYVEPSPFHPILRDLAFTLPVGVSAGEVASHLQRSGPAWLRRVDITDEYVHADTGERTITFALSYATDGESRTADEVNAASEYLIKAVGQRFGERGVRLR